MPLKSLISDKSLPAHAALEFHRFEHFSYCVDVEPIIIGLVFVKRFKAFANQYGGERYLLFKVGVLEARWRSECEFLGLLGQVLQYRGKTRVSTKLMLEMRLFEGVERL
jgi:hypothetical protein